MEKINMAKEGECIRILHVIGAMNLGGAETLIMNLYRNIDRTKVLNFTLVFKLELQFIICC